MKVYYPKAVAVLDFSIYDYGNASVQTEFTVNVEPTDVSVNINAYTMADTCSLSMRFEDVPFDPRLIRAVRILISIQDLKGLRSFAPENLDLQRESIIFFGFADSSSITLDSSTRSIRMEGRDYTSLFIDTRYDNANLVDEAGLRTQKISLNQPLINVLRNIISNVSGAEAIQVDDRTGEAVKNVAVAVPNYDLLNGRKTSDGQFTYVNQNKTYWDVIVTLCEATGFIVYIELDKLVVTTPRFLFESATSQSKRTIQFIYGSNVSSLEFSRNLGKKKRFNILMRSHQIRDGNVIQVSIPREAQDNWLRAMNLAKDNVKIKSIDASGVMRERNAPAYVVSQPNVPRTRLVEIGQKVFEEFIRQQLEGSLDTYEMRVDDTQGVEFDLTKIKVGATILIDITPDDIRHIMRFTPTGERISDGDRVNYLVSKGYKRSIAQELVRAVASGQGRLRPTFYVSDANISLSNTGFSLSLGFVNYINLGELIDGQTRSG